MSNNGEEERLIYAEAVLVSKSGKSLFGNVGKINRESIDDFKADPSIIEAATNILESRGFKVLASGQFALSILAPRELYKAYFSTDIMYQPTKSSISEDKALGGKQLAFTAVPRIPEELTGKIEKVYIPPRVRVHAMPNAQTLNYYCLNPPPHIIEITKADRAHGRNFRGKGVKVAMVDTGLVAAHEYYANTNNQYYNGKYNIAVIGVPGANTHCDQKGHGTGISSNLLAISPDCEFYMYKYTFHTCHRGSDPLLYYICICDSANDAPIAAFKLARAAGVNVISCSWGMDYDPVLESEIAQAINSGITVIFSCGNVGMSQCPDFPACMDQVISVGGVYRTPSGTLEASTFAQSGYNNLYKQRHCPDVCGICGQASEDGKLIVMPTEAGSCIDQTYNLRSNDKTRADDGWFVASGTSAAAAQVAGGAALLLSAKPGLSPAEIKTVLMETATDVTVGTSGGNEQAGRGVDPLHPVGGTGAGLINLEAAVDKVNPPLYYVITGFFASIYNWIVIKLTLKKK